MKIGVLLSGAGVYDGAEIQEAVLTLLEIEKLGYEAVCIGIDAPQHHVVNHLNGEEQAASRNMLEEAARKAGQKLTLRRQEGYDHSYFFIATFVCEHVAFHAARLA